MRRDDIASVPDRRSGFFSEHFAHTMLIVRFLNPRSGLFVTARAVEK